MRVGVVLDEAWSLYTKFFLRFLAIALVVFAIVNLVYALFALLLGGGEVPTYSAPNLSGEDLLLMLVGLATGVVGTFWLQGALVYAVQDARDGTIDARLEEIFRNAVPHLGALIVVGVLAGLGIALGLVLLIVPGLFLMTIWAVVAPVVVLERPGVTAAFGRSRELVRGHGWAVFAVIVIAALATAIAGGLLRSAFSSLPPFLEILVGATIASAVVAPFGAIALTVTYFRLREQAAPAGDASLQT